MPMEKGTKKLGPNDGFGQKIVRHASKYVNVRKQARDFYRKSRTEGLGN